MRNSDFSNLDAFNNIGNIPPIRYILVVYQWSVLRRKKIVLSRRRIYFLYVFANSKKKKNNISVLTWIKHFFVSEKSPVDFGFVHLFIAIFRLFWYLFLNIDKTFPIRRQISFIEHMNTTEPCKVDTIRVLFSVKKFTSVWSQLERLQATVLYRVSNCTWCMY